MRLRVTRPDRLAVLLAVALTDCGDGAGPPSAAQLIVTNGDGQVALLGTLLPGPIIVTVVDGTGQPMPGMRVEWQAVGEDRLIPLDEATGADGRARAGWLLEGQEGRRSGQAVLPGVTPAVFSAVGEREQWLPFDQPIPLDFDTYEGSHQVVHPDYAATPEGAFDHPFHLAITPYPYGNARAENPSFFDGDRRDTWALSAGVPNPVVLPETGYLSDPDLVFVPELGELRLYYRQVAGGNIVLVVRTRDGRSWSAPVEVARAPSHELVSPSVVRRAPDDWWMFSVNAGVAGCDAVQTTVEVRRSADGLQWGPPAPVTIDGQVLWPWHIDVQWIPSRQAFWAVYNAKTDGGCATPAAYIAESADGVAWQQLPQPVLVKGTIPSLQDIVYRTTFEYEPLTDAITFWFSGARYEGSRYVWSAAVERRHRADVFTPEAALDATFFSPAPAPLVDWP